MKQSLLKLPNKVHNRS